MLRWLGFTGWLVCAWALLQKLDAREAAARSATVTRRIERRISLLGVEWTTTLREMPASAAGCIAHIEAEQ